MIYATHLNMIEAIAQPSLQFREVLHSLLHIKEHREQKENTKKISAVGYASLEKASKDSDEDNDSDLVSI